jgi:hypothetical protein
MNLPKWPGASHCYGKAYAMLARMGAGGHVAASKARPRQCVPSDEMIDLIDALNKGHEERVKGLLMVYGGRGF